MGYLGLLSFVSSLLVGVAFWFEPLWFLAGVALLPVFYAIDRARSRLRGFAAALLFVLAAALILGWPLLSFRSVQSVIPVGAPAYFMIAVVSVYLLVLALLAAVALWAPFALPGAPRFWRMLLVPLVWVAFEWVKVHASSGFYWIFAGEPLIEFPPLAVFSRLGGGYLLSFLTVWCNVALYEGLIFFFTHRRREPRRAVVPLAGALAVIGVLVLGGWQYDRRASQIPSGAYGKATLHVAVVQPGSAQFRGRRDFFDDVRERTQSIVRPEQIAGVGLLILPGDYFRSLSRDDLTARDLGAEVLGFSPDVSAVLVGAAFPEGGRRYQVLILQSRAAAPQAAFKEALLPFSDFVPKFLRAVYPAFPDPSGKYSPGRNRPLVLPAGVVVGALACNEEFVPSLAARLTREGARLLIISGSVDDFDSRMAYREALRAARFRAVENGVFVVQAMKNGISAIIDPRGTVVQMLDKDARGVLVGEILVGAP